MSDLTTEEPSSPKREPTYRPRQGKLQPDPVGGSIPNVGWVHKQDQGNV